MSVTPIKMKTVTFQMPVRAATAPVQPSRLTKSITPKKEKVTNTGMNLDTGIICSKIGTKPDLIADIPKTTQLNKKTQTCVSSNVPQVTIKAENSIANDVEKQVSSPIPPQQEEAKSAQKKSGKKKDHESPISPPAWDRSITNCRSAILKVRALEDSVTHDHIRLMKYDVARMREKLVKLEEELKLSTRGRATLEEGIQDIRKCISVNQQSISTQQKKAKRSEEEITLKLLQEESRVLSKSKRRLEQHLTSTKTQLQNLDTVRKTLKAKIAVLSRALGLDAQAFKVYHGPVTTLPESISKKRHYSNACSLPKEMTGSEGVTQLCCKVVETMGAAKTVRVGIKQLLQSVCSKRTEAHNKITTAVTKNAETIKAHQHDLVLQKGKVRLEQNSVTNQHKKQEIALGVALGPISELHRSVSEKIDRPLSRLRPESAVVESNHFKHTTKKLTRHLSASAVRASQVARSDTQLVKEIDIGVKTAGLDSQLLRARKASLENKHRQSFLS